MKQADDHLMQVLQMLDTVEWETQQMQVFEGLKAGNSLLNEMHKVGECDSDMLRCCRFLTVMCGRK